MSIPTAYEAGYGEARKLDSGLATRYVEHTVVGDPVADAVVAALAPFDSDQVRRFIHAGMERDEQTLADAPKPLRDFFHDIEAPPSWFDPDAALPGRRAFHTYSDLFIPTFFVATLLNFTTLMSKAFCLTERVTSDAGVRRVRQNVRHFIEIMLPGAMQRHGEGWKLSVRIRLVHAQVRRLIRASGQWDESVYGVPLSGAHMGLASANFSATQLRLATRLGARMDDAARAGFMQIWRYASTLSGTPEALLFEGDEAATNEFSRIAHACEPPPGNDSVVISNRVVTALPKIAERADPDAAQAMVEHGYRVSRMLLGDEIADRLGFPGHRTTGLLLWMQTQRRLHGLIHRILPSMADRWRGESLAFLLDASHDRRPQLPDPGQSEDGSGNPVVGRNAASPPPVFVLGTGRCGSTMVSNILNRHPRVLSLSELFSYLGMRAFRRRRPTGEWMWDLCSHHRTRTGLMVREDYEELLYPFGAPNARYTRGDVPPLLCAALPHLTDEHEALFEEIEPVVRGQPRQPLADHFRHLFGWLCTRFDRDVWVERSGGSLLFASALLRRFSDARVIHVYRDGRETAISMSRHYPFRMLVASLRVLRSRGVDVMALIARDRLWDLVNPWMEPVVNAFIKPEHLPYDKLTLADFATLWNVLIAKGHRLFADLPPDRLLNLRFEDVQADPEAQIRRLVRFVDPALEDETWLREVCAIPRPTPSKFERLEAAERAAITQACRPGLERLGYPL